MTRTQRPIRPSLMVCSLLLTGAMAGCGAMEDGAGEAETESGSRSAAISHCVDGCNPGIFQGKRWTCRANTNLPVGNSCSTGWETCVPGCNPGHFQGTLWTCDANPRLLTGGTCASGWRTCNPNNCPGVVVVNWDNDGCSGPPTPYHGVFYNACVGHDRCYGTPGRSKSSCDLDFRGAMRSTCSIFDVACLSAAEGFYLAVVAGGGSAYNAGQNATRNATIVLDHLRSFYP